MTGARPEASGWTTGALAELLGAELLGPDDIALSGIEPIDAAGPGALTFIRSSAYLGRWNTSRAGAALVSRGLLAPDDRGALDTETRAILLVDNADLALNRLLAAVARDPWRPEGVSPLASIDPAAKVHGSVRVGAFVTIGPESVVGPGSILHTGVTIGAEVRIGEGCELHARVVVQDRCVIGDRVVMHPGVVIGADGFGYLPAPEGKGLVKIPHAGTVEIRNDVEIGANSCVDRGKFAPTVVGEGTKIDNLCQIAHNVRIGRSCIICGSCAIGGSSVLGDGVTLAGKVGVADNLTLGDGATVSAYSAVMRDIPAGQTWGGAPAQPFTAYMRAVAGLNRLPELLRRVRSLGGAAGDETPTRS